jgi:hypothetical protein
MSINESNLLGWQEAANIKGSTFRRVHVEVGITSLFQQMSRFVFKHMIICVGRQISA